MINRRQFLNYSAAFAGMAAFSRYALAANPYFMPEDTAIRPFDIAGARFPEHFFFGTATASYQVEGAWKADGKGESIWDRFAHTQGKIKGGDTGDVACDTYHRYKEDVAIMKQLNQKSCRFSVAWTRIQPTGTGEVNQKGLDFYSRFVDELLAAGIRPMCTVFHWDLPQALEDQGGWPRRDTYKKFADYSAIVAKSLGDRVDTWAIFNEPWVFTMLGYGTGIHAPGKKDMNLFLKAAHTVNLAQGEAFRAMKAASPRAKIGSAYSMSPGEPATNSAADKAATERFHAINNIFFLETALHGRYPDAFEGSKAPYEIMGMRSGDDRIMRAPLDWVGINYYNRHIVSDAGKGGEAFDHINEWMPAVGPITYNGWEVWPRGLYDIVTKISKEYNRPIIEITENGCAYSDAPLPEDMNKVPDARRIDFFKGHLAELARAIKDGADVRGYHAWSLLDNFEWAEGYSQRFGLTYVDFRDLRRTVKDSGHWYGRVAASGRLEV
ncbi:MAG: GH1 family beta-glucosidase [Acidobacteriaceae bacterium]